MRLTKNFTLAELTTTTTTLDNTPPPSATANLLALAVNLLQPAREQFGQPITVNSGYRCPAVNARVGGAPSSQHLTGQAADLTAGSKEQNRKLFALLAKMDFDQLIDEKDMTWIHVSYKTSGNRHQKLKL